MDFNEVVSGVMVAVIPVIIFYFKQAVPKLPRVVVWTLPMVLGGVLSAVLQLIPAIPGPATTKGILLGAVAMVLRELVSTIKEHGING